MTNIIQENNLADWLTKTDFYKTIATKTPVGVFIHNGKNFVYVNPGVSEISGFTEAELLNMSFDALIQPDDKKLVQERASARLKGLLPPNNYPVRISTKTGQIKWIELCCSQEIINAHNVILGTATDITERVLAEQELKQSEKKYSSLVENAPLGVILLDKEGTIIYENQSFRNVIGVPMGQQSKAMGTKIQLMPNVVQAGATGAITDLLKGQPIKNLVIPFISIYKKELFLSVNAFPIQDENLQPNGGVMMIQDITEKKKMEDNLRESEERYRTLVETTDTGFVIIDAQGAVLGANNEYLRLTGKRKLADILGHSVLEWTAPYEKEKKCCRGGCLCSKWLCQRFRN